MFVRGAYANCCKTAFLLRDTINTGTVAGADTTSLDRVVPEEGNHDLQSQKPDSLTKYQRFTEKVKHTGNIFVRFVRSFNDMDTTYIIPNYYNYTAMVQNTNFRQDFRLRGTSEDDLTQLIHLSPAPAFKIGPYFGWRWIFLGYTFDVGHPKQAGKTTEFNLSLYSSMLGVDLVYIKNKSDFKIKRVDGFGTTKMNNVSFGGFDTYTACINAYYVFNHTRFSYPAAQTQQDKRNAYG